MCFFNNRGCLFIIVGAFSIEVVCQLVSKILIFQIYNLTTFLPSGDIGPEYPQYGENSFAVFFNTTIVGEIFVNF